MKNLFYKIKFQNSSSQLNDEYERFSEQEKQKIYDLDCESFFDFHDHDDNYICFMICQPTELEKYSEILSSNLVTHTITDLTLSILKFEIDLESELNPLLSTVNSIKYSFFIDDINSWLLQNLDMDIILDRILDIGIDNLSNVEKEFLKNYHS